MGASNSSRVLLIADRRSSAASRVLKRAGFDVVMTFTADHAVATCVSNEFAAVVLDQDLFIEVDGWSVAQSLKMVRPNQCIVLISRSDSNSKKMPTPKAVDSVVNMDSLRELPGILKDLQK